MISLEPAQTNPIPNDLSSSPRISFSSADFLDESEFISISINSGSIEKDDHETELERENTVKTVSDFEFLSGNNTTMLSTADELFFEGKMLPLWQAHDAEKSLTKINLKGDKSDNKNTNEKGEKNPKEPVITSYYMKKDQDQQQQPRIWYIDDDPSPRPPKCTVLWKELLRLKQRHQRVASSLSPSSSSSSSSSSNSLADAAVVDHHEDKGSKRNKKGLGRSRSSSGISIRPMVNVPICKQGKNNSSSNNDSSFLPPLFPLKKGKI